MNDGYNFMDIILFAMIAIFLILRLRSVLGRRDGHEGNFRDMFNKDTENDGASPRPHAKSNDDQSSEDNIVRLPKAARGTVNTDEEADYALDTEPARPSEKFEGPLAGALEQMRDIDGSFRLDDFLDGARMAFEMILNAFVEGDTRTLKNLLSPDVYANFESAIRAREEAGQRLEETLVGFSSVEAVEAYLEGSEANLTIKFTSDQISALFDAEGEVIDGDATMIHQVVDFWTFARDLRSKNPNWLLVATRSLD